MVLNYWLAPGRDSGQILLTLSLSSIEAFSNFKTSKTICRAFYGAKINKEHELSSSYSPRAWRSKGKLFSHCCWLCSLIQY